MSVISHEVQVWIKDRHGCYLWVNRAFLKNYAVNDEAPCAELGHVRGKTDYDLCPAYLADHQPAVGKIGGFVGARV
jgi:hypothetical protein